MRVLFVEDEADTRLTVGQGLAIYGFSVRVAENGLVARQALQEETYDAVVTDFNMPHGVSGIEIAREVRMSRPRTKVLLVSGYARAQLPALPDGVAYLSKPYRISELASVLRGMLGRDPAP